MKHKLANMLDSILSSGVNFLITFILLKTFGNSGVVSFGIAITVTLVLMSFQRSVLLIPFNMGGKVANKDILKRFLNDAIWMYVLFTILVFLYTNIVNFDRPSIFFSLALFSYMFIHELTRYVLLTAKFFFIPVSSSALLALAIAALFVIGELSFISIAIVYFVLAFIEVAFLYVHYRKIKRVSIAEKTRSSFSEFKLLINRNLQSGSQLFLVHVSVLVAAEFYPASIVASLFVARSVFQPIQIIVKTIESFDQRKLNNTDGHFNLKVIGSFVRKYFFITTSGAVICLIAAILVLPIFYDESMVPAIEVLICWGGIFICLGIAKCFDMFMIKKHEYFNMNAFYFVAGLIAVVSIYALHLINSTLNPSFALLAGWLVLILFYVLLFKTKEKTND